MQKAVESKESKKNITNPWVNIRNKPRLENKEMFEILFLHDDADQSVEVEESSIINFNQITEQLRQGNSVFIAPKKNCNSELTQRKQSKEKRASSIPHV